MELEGLKGDKKKTDYYHHLKYSGLLEEDKIKCEVTKKKSCDMIKDEKKYGYYYCRDCHRELSIFL